LQGLGTKNFFIINGNVYQNYIYQWARYIQGGVFLFKKCTNYKCEKQQHFAKCQEIAQKDVDCCFRVLQAKFQVITNPNIQWNREVIVDV
jgi:hypothetical protein